jgi:putative MATE family efflux protein
MDEKYIRMTQAPVERLVCSMAVPTIATMMIASLYNMADTYFVGSLGTQATAGVGVSFSLMIIIQAIGFFFGSGTGNYISRQLGAQNWEKASIMAITGFLSAVLGGVALSILGLIFLEPCARFLGATETILPYTCNYLFYIFIGAPWMVGSLVLNHMLRFQGSAFYGMIGMASGAALNVVLDPIFIFVFGMGVSGAALATMLSQAVSFCLLLVGCTRKGNIHLSVSKFSPSFAIYKDIARGGFPSLIRQGFGSVATICMNQVAGGFGDEVIAAISIVQRVTMFANSVLLGFGQGFQPVCGFNYGAKRYDRVMKAFKFCLKTSFFVALAFAIIGALFAPNIIAVFRKDDPDVIRIGTLALRLQCISFPLCGWIVLCNMMTQTIGKALRASFLALSRQGLFLLPILFLLTPRLGVLGIQMSQALSDMASALFTIPLSIGILLKMSRGEAAGKQNEPNENYDSEMPL